MKLKEVLLTVANYLEKNEIQYVVVGGFAAIVWGRGRTTYDIDIIVNQDQLNVEEFVEFLNSKDLITNIDDIKTAFKKKAHSYIRLHGQQLYRIDLQGIYTQQDRETIKTAKAVTYSDQKIQFGSPENIIAFKLKHRSERDLEDALVVFMAQRENLDMKYLLSLCSRLGVKKELKEIQIKADQLKY
ncbi:MAG: nucleotidyltransferase domain-containing protein [Promethearchaeota archaeon]